MTPGRSGHGLVVKSESTREVTDNGDLRLCPLSWMENEATDHTGYVLKVDLPP